MDVIQSLAIPRPLPLFRSQSRRAFSQVSTRPDSAGETDVEQRVTYRQHYTLYVLSVARDLVQYILVPSSAAIDFSLEKRERELLRVVHS
jgi:hypothetical protein